MHNNIAMTGRDKIEAALSSNGAKSIPVIIPYESILVRDRWEELAPNPWWDLHSPDLQVQMQWRRKVLKRIEHDFLELPLIWYTTPAGVISIPPCTRFAAPLPWERRVSGSRNV